MKRFYIILIFVIFCIVPVYPYAQVLVQKGDNIKIYSISELQKAFDDAESGSDVYIPGGFKFTGGFIVKKKVNIYGAGAFSKSTGATGISEIETLYFINGSDSSSMEGVLCELEISRLGSQKTSNLTFRKNKFKSLKIAEGDTSKNIYFKDCIIFWTADNKINTKASSINFYNCIFDKSSHNVYPFIFQYVYNSNFFNSIFHLRIENGYLFFNNNNSANNLFENCIFRNTNSIERTGRLNMFVNCLTTAAQSSWGTENIVVDCLVNQNKDSVFVSIDNTTNVYSENNDYHLISSCLGKNYGTDGTDLGIYGTSSPFKENGVPIIPRFLEFTPALKSQNGMLEVQVEVESQTK